MPFRRIMQHSDLKKPFVSIIFPFYNREKYIPFALKSIQAQTYTHYELIAVDDGSEDNSYAVVQFFEKTFEGKLKIIRQSNKGPAHARNAAIEIAKGDLIAFLDSDDVWHEDKLKRQIELYARVDDVAFIYSGYTMIDNSGKIIRECMPDKKFQGRIYTKLWTHHNDICGGTLLVEKKKLLAAGFFDPELRGAENLDLRLRLAKTGNVFYNDTSLYFYRRHAQSLTDNKTMMRDYHAKLVEKHFIKTNSTGWLFRWVQAKLFYNDGMMQFAEKKMITALGLFLKSILWNPFYVRSYVQAFRCCLGKNVNEFLSRLKSGQIMPNNREKN